MLRDSTLYGSIGVLSLVVCLVFMDYRKASDKFSALSSARPNSQPYFPDQTVAFSSNVNFAEGHVRLFEWSQTLNVQCGSIPIEPCMMPFSRNSMEAKVSEICNQLSAGQRINCELPIQHSTSPWSAYDDYRCRFTVAMTRIDRAMEVAFGKDTRPGDVMTDALQGQLDNQTDFILADFEVRIATEREVHSGGSDTVWRCRIWHEYARDAWHIISLTRELEAHSDSFVGVSPSLPVSTASLQ